MTQAPYKLSVQLAGHEADVRCISACNSNGVDVLLSCSRDQTAKLWVRNGGREFQPAAVLQGHQGFVNACRLLQDDGGRTIALTAGQDKTINAYHFDVEIHHNQASLVPDYTLVGHTENVCALNVGPNASYIVSGSWDKTAKIWKNWQCIATLRGHQQAVWAVLAVDDDRVLTASADKTLRLWSISQPSAPIATFTGHTDAIRGLVLLDGGQSFASSSNDGTINLYSLVDASSQKPIQPLQTLSGHTSFVYSLATIPGGEGELVSTGEDQSARVWKDGNLVQTIIIPAISVWAVAVLANGDVACGSSDSFVRVFSRHPSLYADAEELQAYQHTVSSQTLNKTQVGDIQKDKLPEKEQGLSTPGTKDGQTKMIRNGDIVEAYQWASSFGKWEKIGEVVGGVGSGQKKLYEGKEYDHVFDVDIADGVPPLKLPYNSSENPYLAAQRFLEKNDLSLEYVDQVVKFIDKNTEGVSIGASEYVDPYTGSSRYTATPASSSAGAGYTAATTSASGNAYTGVGNVDPLTSVAPTSAPQGQRPGILPQRTYLSFQSANFSAIQSKIHQLNQQESVQLSVQELEQVDQLISMMQASKPTSEVDVGLLAKMGTSWSLASRFPSLDLLRCLAVSGAKVGTLELAKLAFDLSEWSHDWPSAGSPEAKARDVNSMLALRLIANLWNNPAFVGDLEIHGISILGSLQDTHFTKLRKNARVAYATVVYNSTAQLVNLTSKVQWTSLSLDLINEILEQEQGDSEVIYRTLMALGNLLYSNSGNLLRHDSVDKAKNLTAKWARSTIGNEARIVAITGEISSL